MGPIGRLVRGAILATIILVVVVIAGVVIISQTRQAHELVRATIVNQLAQTYQGNVEIGAVDGSLLGDLEIHNIVLSQRGESIVTVPLARVRYALFPLVAGWIRLAEVELVQPRVNLVRTAGGAWNVVTALEVKNPAPKNAKSGGGYRVSIRRFKISDANIEIEAPSRSKCRLTNTNLEATASMEPGSSLVQIETVDSRISCGDLPQVSLHAEITAHQFHGAVSANVSAFSLKTQASEIDAWARVYDVAKARGQGVVQIRRLAASDLNALYPDLGFARGLAGAIKVGGEMAEAHLSAAIVAGNARTIVQASTRANRISFDYQAAISLSGLKIDQLLKERANRQLPGGTIAGTVHAQGNGRDLADLSAEADLQDEGLAMGAWRAGNLTLTGKLMRQVASIDAALTNGVSRLEMRGTVGLKEPSYQLALAMNRVDLRAFARQPSSLVPTDLNLKANLHGVGIDLKRAQADGTLELSRSIVGTIKIGHGELRTGLSQGLLRIRQATIEANDSSLNAQGTAALLQDGRVSLNYSLRAATLTPWFALAAGHGRGHLELAGTVDGNLDQLRARGSSNATDFQLGKYSARHARLIYEVVRVRRQGGFSGEVELTAEDVNAAERFKSLVTTVHLSGGPPQLADVSCEAIDQMARRDQIDARLLYQPGDLRMNLTTLSLTTAGGAWILRRTGEFSIRKGVLQVRNFELVSGNQSLTVEGRASRAGAQDLQINARRVSLAALAAMSPRSVPIDGLLSAHLQLSGEAAAPIIDAAAVIDDLNVSGLRYLGFEARAAYAARKALIDVALRQDTTHSLRANGTIPLNLAWVPQFQAESVGDMDVHARSRGIDIAFLDAFTSGTTKKLQGALAVDISATGPLRDPRPQGYVEVIGARCLIKPLNVDVTNATARIDFDARQMRLVRLLASAGDGTLSGRGALELEGYLPRRVDVAVSLEKWPAIATHEFRSVIAGALNCSGPLNGLRVKGSIESLSGLIRPDLSLFKQQSLKPDETIHVSRSDVESKPGTSGVGLPNTSATAPNDITIDLDIKIDRDNWIKTEEAQVELQGELQTKKPAGGPVDVVGTIHTVRGNVSVAGKRFDLVRGDINFVGGGQIDPALDLLAQDKVQKYMVSASITGPASKPDLRLSSVPSLEQADILSMVMFGRPVNQLSGSQQQNLQKQAMGMAASQAGRAIADALGLEDIGVATTETGGVGVGRYVTQNIYLSASQETVDPRKRRGSVSYYLTPEININTSTSTGQGNQIELQWHKDY